MRNFNVAFFETSLIMTQHRIGILIKTIVVNNKVVTHINFIESVTEAEIRLFQHQWCDVKC